MKKYRKNLRREQLKKVRDCRKGFIKSDIRKEKYIYVYDSEVYHIRCFSVPNITAG